MINNRIVAIDSLPLEIIEIANYHNQLEYQ